MRVRFRPSCGGDEGATVPISVIFVFIGLVGSAIFVMLKKWQQGFSGRSVALSLQGEASRVNIGLDIAQIPMR